MRFRLNMTKIKAEYKGKYNDLTCDCCGAEQETTEHIVNCKEYKRLFKCTKTTEEITTTSTTELLSFAQYIGEIEQYKRKLGLW